MIQAGGTSLCEAKGHGLGPGLPVVRNLVELHGGTIRAENSGKGQGPTFTVRLPVAAILPTIVRHSQRPIKRRVWRLKILLDSLAARLLR